MGRYCPPCEKCAFPAKSQSPVSLDGARVIVPRSEYACVGRAGAELVQTADGDIGVTRDNGTFYPITEAGVEFHRQQGSNSPLAAFI